MCAGKDVLNQGMKWGVLRFHPGTKDLIAVLFWGWRKVDGVISHGSEANG